MTDKPKAALLEAARAICRALGIDPDAASSSAYDAPAHWEAFLPHARAAGASFATMVRVQAEIARAAAMVCPDQIAAERLKARADALHEVAALLDDRPDDGKVVAFRRR